ncbi:hypothetical protein SAMN05421767_12732 [Granulicatella balaenopterae]|uniref:Lipoprotein n=1 Tax=Granulicatella balaenopterae TaxID=137733 RepID=A0A1H9MJX1_9LACT|nr:hypothetical protein SAMN05421767_12732 [Granulicatella balaenopterae]
MDWRVVTFLVATFLSIGCFEDIVENKTIMSLQMEVFFSKISVKC